MSGWRLICPPKNWQNPVPISEEEVATLSIVANRLDLPYTMDKAAKKVYLGSDPTPAPMKLTYPSGWSTSIVSQATAGAKYGAVEAVMAAPLIASAPDAKLSPNFSLSEFRPGRGSWEYIRISPDLVRVLEEIRARAGGPVVITSAYRPSEYNREVGGESNSTHIDGLAADIYVERLSTEQLRAICEQVIGQRGGVGYYPKAGFIHVDVRGQAARWTG